MGNFGRKLILSRLGTHFEDCIKARKVDHKYDKQC